MRLGSPYRAGMAGVVAIKRRPAGVVERRGHSCARDCGCRQNAGDTKDGEGL